MNPGDMVIIKECHKIPELVGKEGKVLAMVDPEASPYPIQVVLTEKVKITTPFGEGETAGPFPFRENELELHNPPKGNEGVPEVFTQE